MAGCPPYDPVWDPAAKRSKVQVLYNFGREDAASREAPQRLAASLAQHLEPGKARAAAADGLKPLVNERVGRPIRVRLLVIAEPGQLKIVDAPVHHVHSSDNQRGPAQLCRLPLPGSHVVLRDLITIGQDIHVSDEAPQGQIRVPRLSGRSTQPGPHAIRDSI